MRGEERRGEGDGIVSLVGGGAACPQSCPVFISRFIITFTGPVVTPLTSPSLYLAPALALALSEEEERELLTC